MARSTTPAPADGDTPFPAFVTLRGNRRNERLTAAVLIVLMLPGSMLANENFHVPVVTAVPLLAGLAAFAVVYLRRRN